MAISPFKIHSFCIFPYHCYNVLVIYTTFYRPVLNDVGNSLNNLAIHLCAEIQLWSHPVSRSCLSHCFQSLRSVCSSSHELLILGISVRSFLMQWFPLAFYMIVFRHTVELLWTSDQPVSEASTYTGQHNILWHVRFSLVTWSMHHIAFP
jgi:hypothetical protein